MVKHTLCASNRKCYPRVHGSKNVPEKEIEQYFKTQIKKLGGMALKFESPGFTGVPDRLVLMPNGKIFFAEIKRASGKLSSRQEFVIKQFEALGIKVYVIKSKEQVDYVVQTL